MIYLIFRCCSTISVVSDYIHEPDHTQDMNERETCDDSEQTFWKAWNRGMV